MGNPEQDTTRRGRRPVRGYLIRGIVRTAYSATTPTPAYEIPVAEENAAKSQAEGLKEA
jgi:hypothetical protein